MAFNFGAALEGFSGGLFQGASNSMTLMSNYYDLNMKAEQWRTYQNASQQVREEIMKGGYNPYRVALPGSGGTATQPASATKPAVEAPTPAPAPPVTNAPILYPPGQAPVGAPEPPPAAPIEPIRTGPGYTENVPATLPDTTTKIASATPPRMASTALGGTTGRDDTVSQIQDRAAPPFGGTTTGRDRNINTRFTPVAQSSLPTDTPLVYLPPQMFTQQTAQQQQPRRTPLLALQGAGGYVPYVG